MRRTKKVAAGLLASTAMAVGFATAGPGTAAAAEKYVGPELSVTQGAFPGGNVELKLTNPNDPGLIGAMCTSVLLDGAQGLEAVVAFNNNDFGKLVQLMTSQSVKPGPGATNVPIFDPGPNSDTKVLDVATGVYVYVGTCGGVDTALDPSNVGVSIAPVIVPDGLGSLSPAMAFGSAALESGDDILGVLATLAKVFGALG